MFRFHYSLESILFVTVYLEYMNIPALFRIPPITFSLPYVMMGDSYTVSCCLFEHSTKTTNTPTDCHETWCEFQEPACHFLVE